MRRALLLVDLQHDFLRSARLEPPAGEVVARSSALLEGCRAAGAPVFHIWTSITGDEDRMPHWRAQGRWLCLTGTEGHATPDALRPGPGEDVVSKTFFSAFSNPTLEARLRELAVQGVLLAGVHLHGCVRVTALDAYQRGFDVRIVDGAVGSYDGLHAEVTRRYLHGRAARFVTCERALQEIADGGSSARAARPADPLPAAIVDAASIASNGLDLVERRSPRCGVELPSTPVCDIEVVRHATAAARTAGERWRATAPLERRATLDRVGDLLEREAAALAGQMAVEIGKPVSHARAEVARAVKLTTLAARIHPPEDERTGDEAVVRRRALGVVALVTPFNNPVAVPLGKIAPALAFGNTVVWKPAPAASGLALRIMEIAQEAGLPPGVVNMVCGDRTTAQVLMRDPLADAFSVTGSAALGHAAALTAAERGVPLQAELGGNNAAIVWSDCDLSRAAAGIALAGFGSAGQRCTANRRVVVDERCCESFLTELERATAGLRLGDPLEPETDIGPLVSEAAAARVGEVVARARDGGCTVSGPHTGPVPTTGSAKAYCRPVIVRCDDPGREIVQHETFGPVVVVQRARGFDEALRLLNAVPQGLVASLFSSSPERQDFFLERAQAGVLKLGAATADVGVETPFGGWKASGMGPPEHGEGNREFYTRAQSLYPATSG